MDDSDLRENRERPSQNSARVEKEYAVSTDELSRAVLKAVSQLSNWSVEKGDSEGDFGEEVHAVRTTKVLRFKDDISISISETDTGAKLVADSESRVGKSDLGQNPRNIDELLETIEEVNVASKPRPRAQAASAKATSSRTLRILRSSWKRLIDKNSYLSLVLGLTVLTLNTMLKTT